MRRMMVVAALVVLLTAACSSGDGGQGSSASTTTDQKAADVALILTMYHDINQAFQDKPDDGSTSRHRRPVPRRSGRR